MQNTSLHLRNIIILVNNINRINIDDFAFGLNNVLKRNLLNVDEILRIPSSKLILNLRGNKPLLLDKVIYTENPLSSSLKDNSVNEYNPKWIKNTPKKVKTKEKAIGNTTKQEEEKQWTTF